MAPTIRSIEYRLEDDKALPFLKIGLKKHPTGMIITGEDASGKRWNLLQLTNDGYLYRFSCLSKDIGLKVDAHKRIELDEGDIDGKE